MDPITIAATAFGIIKLILEEAPDLIDAFKGLDPDKPEDRAKIKKYLEMGKEDLKTPDFDDIP